MIAAPAALTAQGETLPALLSLKRLSMHYSTFPTTTLDSLTTSTMIFDNHLPQAHTQSFLRHLGHDCGARIFQDELSELVARHDQLDGKKETVEHMALHQTSRELEDSFDLRKWLRELANALEKDLASQLRLDLT